MKRLDGKVAIVSGARRGIGLACAERLASEGARVVLSDIAEDGADAALDCVRRQGGEAHFVKADVARKPDVEALVAAAVSAFGRLDVLVNNAGIVEEPAPFLEFPVEDLDRVLAVNLRGVFLLSQAAARQMARQAPLGSGRGSIVSLASVNAHFALPRHAAYTISKGGVAQLTKVMAIELAPLGIRANAIGPGTIDTEMTRTVARNEAARRAVLMRTPLGRLGQPSEIAAVAAFLASDDASYMTGQILYPDGGRMHLNYVVEPPAN